MAPEIIGGVPPAEAAIYQASQDAAAQADAERANGIDQANGGAHFNMRDGSSTSPFNGSPIVSQYGPFHNSDPTPQLPGDNVYVNIYR
jgi:hypothetical protein